MRSDFLDQTVWTRVLNFLIFRQIKMASHQHAESNEQEKVQSARQNPVSKLKFSQQDKFQSARQNQSARQISVSKSNSSQHGFWPSFRMCVLCFSDDVFRASISITHEWITIVCTGWLSHHLQLYRWRVARVSNLSTLPWPMLANRSNWHVTVTRSHC